VIEEAKKMKEKEQI